MTNPQDQPCRIIELRAENVKRLKAVTIKPDGSLVVIGGRNEQGKSSVLDAITYALSGGRSLPVEPVRQGEDFAEVEIDLGNFVVRRRITKGGTTTLNVTTRSGSKVSSPQALLDQLLGKLSFDPLRFARMEDRERAEELRKLVGLNLDTFTAKRDQLFNDRTLVNRDLKNLEGQIALLPPFHGDAPAEEISAASLIAEQKAAMAENAENAKKRESLASAKRAEEALGKEVERLEAELRKKAAEWKAACEQSDRLEGELAFLEDRDTSAITAKLDQIEAINRKVRDNANRRRIEADMRAKAESAAGFTAQLEVVAAERREAISKCVFPIPGLSFDDEGRVLFNGVPFSQASSAQQIKVSVAIGLALNPKLRVLLIRDGSLLDKDNLAVVEEMARAADAQIWMERVSEGGEVSVIIEDGEVKS